MPIALESYWISLLQQFHHAQFCSANSLSTPICHDFWTWGLFAVMAVGLLALVPILSREIREIQGYKRYLKKLAERAKIADPEIMAKAMWRGDGAAAQDISEKELANEIRQVITKRRQTSNSQ